MKQVVDRAIGLGVTGEDQRLQRIEMQTIAASGDHPDALGVDPNLRLRNGPDEDEFLDDRGDLADAANFLPAGEDLAFGMPGSLFPALGADAKFRMAEETSPGSGEFRFPIREDASDPESEIKGRIKDISVAPLDGDALRVEVHGEAFLKNLPDPDFRLKFDIRPTIEDGLLDAAAGRARPRCRPARRVPDRDSDRRSAGRAGRRRLHGADPARGPGADR